MCVGLSVFMCVDHARVLVVVPRGPGGLTETPGRAEVFLILAEEALLVFFGAG